MAVLTTNKQIAEAVRRSKVNLRNELTATDVRYVPNIDVFVLLLSNGTRRVLPREELQGLQNASRKQLANVKLVGGGSGLHWPDLDADLSVEGLLRGVFGSKQWMADVGRRGGSVSSEMKAAAARRNGSKGGRPKASHKRALNA